MIGKVLDSSAVAAIAGGSIAATSWLTVALDFAYILYIPALAVTEVRALRPDLAPALDDLALHPSVVIRELTDVDEPVAAAVEELLERTRTYDVLAGHVVHVAGRRGWPAMTSDPERLRRLDPDIELPLLGAGPGRASPARPLLPPTSPPHTSSSRSTCGTFPTDEVYGASPTVAALRVVGFARRWRWSSGGDGVDRAAPVRVPVLPLSPSQLRQARCSWPACGC